MTTKPPGHTLDAIRALVAASEAEERGVGLVQVVGHPSVPAQTALRASARTAIPALLDVVGRQREMLRRCGRCRERCQLCGRHGRQDCKPNCALDALLRETA